MILVKIYFYFAANSFRRKRGALTSCVETKSKGEKVVICMQESISLSGQEAFSTEALSFLLEIDIIHVTIVK